MLNSIYLLGIIYLKTSKYSENYAKSAAIFQYCAIFAKNYDASIMLSDNNIGNQKYFLDQANLVEKQFLINIGIKYDKTIQKTNFKEELQQVRNYIKVKLDEIQNLTNGNANCKTNLIEKIYQDCNNFFVNHTPNQSSGLVQRLLFECYSQLGSVPKGCNYAIIGLGSLALGTMTPWSDLEFAILVNDNKYKDYFRNLVKLLHIEIINLGETILPIMGIETLNNVRTGNEEDEWFWDGIIPRGFSLDGKRWYACKSPLGRQGHYKILKKF